MYLSYVGIRVTDLDRSLRFYTELLGLREVGRGEMTEHDGGTWVLLRDETSGQQLELNWYPKGSRFDVPYVPGEGLDHIGFVVEDVEEAFRKLLEAGAQPTEVDPSSTGGTVAYVRDSDGNWIEFYENSD
jgi:lactoylglutathione lyase